MKRKIVHRKMSRQLDRGTFLILACVVIALLVIFGAQTGTLPAFLIK